MAKNLRIHIAPVGFEFKRVTEPLVDMQADKVYLIRWGQDIDQATKFLTAIKKELGTNHKHIQINEVTLDLWDLYECIEKFREIIYDEKGNHIYINVSTGTKITVIAGMLSCMLWDAEPYYVRVNYHDTKIKTVHSEDVEKPKSLPVHKITKPKPEFIKILNLLQANDGNMRKQIMIKKLEEIKVLRDRDQSGDDLTPSAMHSQLSALLRPMELMWKYVTVKSSGRKSTVSMTEQGKSALKIFGSQYADEDIE